MLPCLEGEVQRDVGPALHEPLGMCIRRLSRLVLKDRYLFLPAGDEQNMTPLLCFTVSSSLSTTIPHPAVNGGVPGSALVPLLAILSQGHN